jgi:iron complex transport system ATP-binding protein
VTLKAQQLSAGYRGRAVLDRIDLALEPGQLAALVGPNGSGKSTLLKCLAGLQTHLGQVTLTGQPRQSEQIGYMPQDLSATAALSVLEAVLLGRVGRLRWQVGDEDLAAAGAVLKRLGVDHLAQRYLTELSGGQRQMVFLAQALVAQPRVLLLDEPISALDLRHQLEVMNTVRALTIERGLVTLAVLHDLNAAVQHADQVLLLHGGKVQASGAPSTVLTPDQIRLAFGVEVLLLEHVGRPDWIAPLRPAVDGARVPP